MMAPTVTAAMMERINRSMKRAIFCAIHEGADPAELAAVLEGLVHAAAQLEVRALWTAALAAAAAPGDNALAARIRMSITRAEDCGAVTATLKVAPARVDAALRLLRAAGFKPCDDGLERAHVASYAPDVRVVTFPIDNPKARRQRRAEPEEGGENA